MIGATLDQNIAGMQRDEPGLIEEHVDLPGQADDVVHRVGAMQVPDVTGQELHHREAAAAFRRSGAKDAGTFIFVAEHLRWACVGRPHQRRGDLVAGEFVIIGMPVDPDDSIAIGVVPGDDAAKFRSNWFRFLGHYPTLWSSSEKRCSLRAPVSVITTVSANTAPVSPLRQFGSKRSMLKAKTMPGLNSPPMAASAA